MLPKETAIDWLVERINHAKIEKILTTQRLYELKKIAKEIEKEQIMEAWNNRAEETFFTVKIGDKSAEKYYNETYGSGVVTEVSGAVNEKSGAVASSCTEISDEEIDKQAELIEIGIYRMFFKTGAKWYREQLKNKQL